MNSQNRNTNRTMGKMKRDSLEMEKPHAVSGSITDFGRDTVDKVRDSFGDMGKGIFDQIMGNYELPQENSPEQPLENQPQRGSIRLEGGNLFNYRHIEDERQMSEIKELLKQIKQEVELIKKADKALMEEVKDAEKVTFETLPNKAGVYDVRFLQMVLKVLELVKAKISESRTWMDAFMNKKAKRGSAFAARSKKAGTSYSMSQELSNSRSVQ